MASQNWVSLLNPDAPFASGAGAALSTATTATLSPVLGTTADVAQVNPAGQYLGWKAGLNIRWTARGFITTTGTSTTAAFVVASCIGNPASSRAFVTLATHAMVLNTGTGALTGIPWYAHGMIRCSAVPAVAGTLATEGEITISANPATAQTVGTATAGVNLYLPSASGETAATVDTTQTQGISLRGTLGGANATIQLTQWLVEALN